MWSFIFRVKFCFSATDYDFFSKCLRVACLVICAKIRISNIYYNKIASLNLEKDFWNDLIVMFFFINNPYRITR